MERYLVISPHTAGECKQALIDVMETGYITHFDWGCADGDHTGWVVIEAESPKQAMMVVPVRHREKARVVRLMKIGPEDVAKMHS